MCAWLKNHGSIIIIVNVTGFGKTGFHAQLQIFRNTEFNYLRYYDSGREADACMKFATIL